MEKKAGRPKENSSNRWTNSKQDVLAQAGISKQDANRATRRLGELSAALEKKAGRPKENSPNRRGNSKQDVLAKAGISTQDANRATRRLGELSAALEKKKNQHGALPTVGRAKKDVLAKAGRPKENSGNRRQNSKQASTQAGKALNVGHTYVAQAKKLKAEHPELAEQVKQGTLTLSKP